jgi:molecular chaperone GrpE
MAKKKTTPADETQETTPKQDVTTKTKEAAAPPTPPDEVAAIKDQMLRDRAELENFKRRINEERIKERKYAQQDLLRKLVDVLDNLERALSADYKDVQLFKDGLKSVVKQVELTLQEESVSEIEALHQPFDATKHQAVMTESTPDHDDQVITEVFQKGFQYKDRILRPSMVKVNHKEE